MTDWNDQTSGTPGDSDRLSAPAGPGEKRIPDRGDGYRGSTASRVSSAMGWSVGAKLARMVIALATSIVVVRGLGSHDYGVLSTVRTILTFLAFVCGLGLGQALLRFMPELRVRRDLEGAKRLFGFIFMVQLAAWATFLVLFILAGPKIEAVTGTGGLALILKVGVALIIIDLISVLLSQTLTSFYDVRLLSIYTTVSLVVTLGITIAFLRLGYGVIGVLVAAAISSAMLCVVLAERTHLHVPLSVRLSFREAGRVFRYSLPFAAIGLLNLVTWRQSETLFLFYFRGPVDAGLFDLGYRLPQQLLEMVPGAVWPLLLATFSEIYTRNRQSLGAAISGYYKLLFVLVAPISIFGAAISREAIPIVFGSPMLASGVLAQIFFAVFSLSFFSTPLSMALYVMELVRLNLIIYIVNAAVNIGLDLVLIPRYGLYGAIVPVALVIAASPFVYYYVLKSKRVAFSIPWGFIRRCYLASLPLGIFFLLARYINSVGTLAAACLAGLALFWGSARLVAIFREEDEVLLDGLGPKIRPLVLGFFGWKGARP